MRKKIRVDEVRIAFMHLSMLIETTQNADSKGWDSDLSGEFDDGLNNDLESLCKEARLLMDALKNHDLVTAKYAITNASVISHNLLTFFEGIKNDIDRAGWSGEYMWPDIPEGFHPPPKYKYFNGGQ